MGDTVSAAPGTSYLGTTQQRPVSRWVMAGYEDFDCAHYATRLALSVRRVLSLTDHAWRSVLLLKY